MLNQYNWLDNLSVVRCMSYWVKGTSTPLCCIQVFPQKNVGSSCSTPRGEMHLEMFGGLTSSDLFYFAFSPSLKIPRLLKWSPWFYSYFSKKINILDKVIFFRWVATTNQDTMCSTPSNCADLSRFTQFFLFILLLLLMGRTTINNERWWELELLNHKQMSLVGAQLEFLFVFFGGRGIQSLKRLIFRNTIVALLSSTPTKSQARINEWCVQCCFKKRSCSFYRYLHTYIIHIYIYICRFFLYRVPFFQCSYQLQTRQPQGKHSPPKWLTLPQS